MPATLTLTADSTRVPGLDGFVTTAGALDTAGDLTFQKATADVTKAWITFEDVPLEKWHRFGAGFSKATQSWPETPVVLRLTPAALPAEDDVDLVLTIRAILEQAPAAIASAADLSTRTLTTQSVAWTVTPPEDTDPIESPDLSPILNEVLEHFPADGRPRSITLVISVAAAADQSLSVKSGEGAGAPQLDVVFQSILNQWRGDATEETGRLKVTVLEAVPYALYSIDFGANRLFSYRGTTIDTTATIASSLATLIGAEFTIEYTDGEDTFVVVSNDPGLPFDFEFPRVPASVVQVVQEGRRPIAQQTRVTLPTPVEGSTLTGTWAITFDFGEGDETIATVAAAASAATLQTAIEGLTTPVPGDIQVDVENVLPRTYLITFQGALAGLPVTVSADGSNLIGCATATVETIQRPGREIHDVQLFWFEQVTNLTQPWEEEFTAFSIAPPGGSFGPIGNVFNSGGIRLDAGSAVWTAAFEEYFGEGNVRVTAYVKNGTGGGSHFAAVMVELLGDYAGVDIGEIGLHTENNSVDTYATYAFEKVRLQNGGGSISNEFALLHRTMDPGYGGPNEYYLLFDGERTAAIDAANTTEIEASLIGLDAITLSDVEVTLPFGETGEVPATQCGLALVKFVGAFDNVNAPDLEPSDTDGDFEAEAVELDPAVASNEIQVYFTSTFPDQLEVADGTISLLVDDDVTDVQTRLDSELGSGNAKAFLFFGDGITAKRAIVIRFQGSLASETQPIMSGYEGSAYRVQDRTETGLHWQVVEISAIPYRNWSDFPGTGFKITQDAEEGDLIRFWDTDDAEEKTGAVRAWLPEDHELHLLFLGFAVADDPVVLTHRSVFACSIVDGSPLLNEIQRVTVRAGGGTLRVKHDEESWSTPFNWPATTGDWQDALDETAGVDNTIAAGLGSPSSPLTVEFIGAFETTEVPLLQIDTSALTGNATIGTALARTAVVGLDEIQRVIIDPNATGGSVRLGLDGRFSGAIAWDAAASTVETALDGTPGIGASNTVVEGAAGSPWIVTFAGDLAKQPIALLTIDQDALIVTGVGVMEVELLTPGAGPNHYATAANWSLGRVPQTHDVVDFGPGRVDVLAGLVQRVEVSIEIPDGDDSVSELVTSVLADLVDGQIVRLHSTSGEFPDAEVGGDPITLDADTDLYITGVSRLDRTLTLALARDGGVIEFTSVPNGTLLLQVCLAQLRHQMSYTGKIGLPPRSIDGLFEDKPQSLRIGFLPARLEVPNLQLGIGEGSGSNRINVDVGVSPLKAEIVNTGGAVGDFPPLLIDGTNDDNELLQVQGETGLAVLSGRSFRFRRIQLMAGRTSMGADVQASDDGSIDVYAGGTLLATDLVTRRCNIRIRGQ